MKLITKKIEHKLRRNHKNADKKGHDPYPVLKLFNPIGAATWLLTELDDDERLFGLCDLGMQCPELGYVLLQEIEEIRLPMGLRIERDRYFTATKPLSEYAQQARSEGRIIT